ncbi:MAG: hypothetical protein CMJ49_08525 [Planctomycetaceae bacterium]|nr:hypothetical protein [Planctomycetaceae bacterium]
MADDRIPFVWTNDDIAHGLAEPLERQLAFLDRMGIPGVFFVVPGAPKPLTEDEGLLAVIRDARGRGHEFYQHGLVHSPFESGVPELWMLQFSDEVFRDYDERRLEIEAQHSLSTMVRMLSMGQAIWREAFGEDSVGYRPGWGAFCGNLYRALDVLGYAWMSSRIPCPTSWLYNQGKFDAPLNFREAVSAAPERMGGSVAEYPMAGDYGFRVPNESDKIDAMVKLGMREMEHYCEIDAPMLMCSHWHGLEHAEGSGYAVHEQLIPRLLDSGRVEPMGMAGLHARQG